MFSNIGRGLMMRVNDVTIRRPAEHAEFPPLRPHNPLVHPPLRPRCLLRYPAPRPRYNHHDRPRNILRPMGDKRTSA
jgi:hypothetical protein